MSEFRFKKFKIKQYKTAAKIGTDAVLLGSWTEIHSGMKNILDIGAGSGIISLMLAQRTENSNIFAIEIDFDAYSECTENFQNSPWNHRLQSIKSDLKEFTSKTKFDLIVSNPPFFTENTLAPDLKRNRARNTVGLSFELLIRKVDELLNSSGVFSVILPYKETEKFCELARKFNLYPFLKTFVKGHKNAPLKRSLMAFSREHKICVCSELVIEIQRHQYTEDYIELTKDFYLKM